MSNPGIAPPDPSTAVGQMRYFIGDTAYVELDPPIAGQGDYALFSDLELAALLESAGDSPTRAVGFAYLKLAGQTAYEAVDWASDDLRLTLSKRPAELRLIANMWLDAAKQADSGEDNFEIVSTGDEVPFWPEATARLYYSW